MTYPEFLARWNAGTDPHLTALRDGGVKALRDYTGLTQTNFAAHYGVPFETVKCWEAAIGTPKHRDISPYLLALLAYVTIMDGVSNQ